jgi:hypothetical protein
MPKHNILSNDQVIPYMQKFWISRINKRRFDPYKKPRLKSNLGRGQFGSDKHPLITTIEEVVQAKLNEEHKGELES